MKLSERYRPSCLSEVVGQPGVAELASFVSAPYTCCWLLEGPGGTGKTTSAFNMAKVLGGDLAWPGVLYYAAGKFGVDDAQEMIRFLKCGICCPRKEHWHVAIIEELERPSDQCIVYLKSALEVDLGDRAVVIATTNNVMPIMAKDMWFLQRFMRVVFMGGEEFAQAGLARVREVAEQESLELPNGWEEWGWSGRNDERLFSIRLALDKLQQFALRQTAVALTGNEIQF